MDSTRDSPKIQYAEHYRWSLLMKLQSNFKKKKKKKLTTNTDCSEQKSAWVFLWIKLH